MLGIFYALNFIICLGGIIAMNYIQFNPDKFSGRSRYYLNIVRALMDCLAFSLTFILSLGFLIYGIAMYRMLHKVDSDKSIFKIRFTQVTNRFSDALIY
jgi:hypothetical protein